MIGQKFCPECGSEDVVYIDGGISGMCMCKECGYTGMFPEREFIGRQRDEIEKLAKKLVKKPVKKTIKKTGRKR